NRPAGARLGADERRVYELVCRRLLQAWHDDFTWAATRVTTLVTTPGVVDRYESHGTAIEQPGWKVLDVGPARPPAEKRAPGDEASDEGLLPAGLAAGQAVRVFDAKPVPRRTRPPPRLNDATLLTAMETAGKTVDERELSEAMRENGLGTPATRANIIETLLARGYVVREGKSLAVTEKGLRLIDVVDPEVKSAAMTGAWEAKLQRIAKGHGSLSEFLAGIERYVEAVIGRIRSAPPRARGAGPGPRGPTPPAPSPHAPRGGPGAARSAPPRATSSSPLGGSFSAETPARASNGTPGAARAAPPRATSTSPLGGSFSAETPAHASNGTPGAARAAPPRTTSSSPLGGSFSAETPSPAPPAAPPRAAPPQTEGDGGHSAAPGSARSTRADPVSLLAMFGHASFRPHQRDACDAAIAGHDVLLVMPTGAGKSLCYQLPGLARGGTTLVISPLIALMEDQATRLQALGLRAERIHSGRPRADSRRVCADYLAGRLDFLFIAPERLGVAGFPELLARRTPSLVAIDEAHCISQWGHDFRPDYRLLGERLPSLRPAPVMALTATATPLVQRDIVTQLGLRPGARQLIHGFRRHNLAIEALEVLPKERPARALSWLLEPGRVPAIVYAATRKSAEATAEVLSRRLRVAPYHAGLSTQARDEAQTAFLRGDLDVIVATVAFGMGVDKPDVRTVLHLALPGSVEGYYQEIGRAGRDGKPSRAVLMHHFVDRKTHEFFLERDYPEVPVLEQLARALDATPQNTETVRRRARLSTDDFEKALEKLWIHGGVRGVPEDQLTRGHDAWQGPYEAQRRLRVEQLALMARYAESAQCRMVSLVKHFGDQTDRLAPCGQCDVCDPAGCVAATFERPTAREVAVLAEVVARLRALPGQSMGRLCKEVLGEAPEARPRFERLVRGLARAGQLRLEDAVFEKDGQAIAYQRLFLAGDADPTRALLAPVHRPAPK
ncbi:MAG: RecQ family ATP-dependent DNA helicase, partial [Myxococcaceae bacterium]|nr:RecQ family ATP-dependent DNA helicase [Myxococcaceae bacterium]